MSTVIDRQRDDQERAAKLEERIEVAITEAIKRAENEPFNKRGAARAVVEPFVRRNADLEDANKRLGDGWAQDTALIRGLRASLKEAESTAQTAEQAAQEAALKLDVAERAHRIELAAVRRRCEAWERAAMAMMLVTQTLSEQARGVS